MKPIVRPEVCVLRYLATRAESCASDWVVTCPIRNQIRSRATDPQRLPSIVSMAIVPTATVHHPPCAERAGHQGQRHNKHNKCTFLAARICLAAC